MGLHVYGQLNLHVGLWLHRVCTLEYYSTKKWQDFWKSLNLLHMFVYNHLYTDRQKIPVREFNGNFFMSSNMPCSLSDVTELLCM